MRHRLFRVLSAFLRQALGAVVRTVVTTFVFGAVVVGLLHYMGVPVPSAHQLLQSFEGLSKLAKILS
jgi:hypothetical protein